LLCGKGHNLKGLAIEKCGDQISRLFYRLMTSSLAAVERLPAAGRPAE